MTEAAKVCMRQEPAAEYSCTLVNDTFLDNVELPMDSCQRIGCNTCINATRTYILKDGQILDPSSFFERPTNNKGNITTFDCHTSQNRGDQGIPCDCTSNCTGTDEFCQTYPCVAEAPCTCEVRKVQYELLHIAHGLKITNPVLLSIKTCLFRIPQRVKKSSRHLLEYEGASFSQNNLTIIFNDPVVTLPVPGKLIARVSGNEIIITVKDDLNVILPAEFLTFKDILTLIFISNSGRAVHGDVFLEGKTICRLSNCIICREFLINLKCWPAYVTYLVYGSLILILPLALYLLSWTCRGVLIVIKIISFLLCTGISFVKSILRLFLLIGAVSGSSMRNYFENFHEFLENRNQQFRPVSIATLLVLVGLFSIVASDCTTHAILNSDIQNCRTENQQRICELATTAEVTLKGIGFESCLWFQDKLKQNVFSLKIKFISAQCNFSSRRKYFTFPVRQKSVSQLACPQNYYCAWGEHCKQNKNFQALTEESLEFPGQTKCEPSSVGSGCALISRMGCLFYRVYYIPDLLHSYEVRSIIGHQCSYTISLERISNGTTEKLTFQSSTVTSDGIQIEILGAYNQAHLHISDSLVTRVGDPTEAYLMPSSPVNRPIAGLVGQIQANSSFTKTFIFDRDLTRCDFFETNLRCEVTPDVITTMTKTKERALPLTQDLHLLSIDKGSLRSQLLSTAPVKMQLHFRNYQISVETSDVCPKITEDVIKTKGCYACQILSELTITAFSLCQAGTVAVEFQIIKLFTQTIFLSTEPGQFVIKLLADQKCFEEKICLTSRNMKNCRVLSFCVNEPSLYLLKLNTTYTNTLSHADSSGSSFFSFLSLPAFKNIFTSLKMLGAILLIICLSITIFSTCVTCCKK